MVLLDLVVVLGVVGVLLYGAIQLALRATGGPAPAIGAGRWHETHFDVDGETHVVVEKRTPDGRRVLDRHLVARIRIDDPGYDSAFLAAMSDARARRALFESEE